MRETFINLKKVYIKYSKEYKASLIINNNYYKKLCETELLENS